MTDETTTATPPATAWGAALCWLLPDGTPQVVWGSMMDLADPASFGALSESTRDLLLEAAANYQTRVTHGPWPARTDEQISEATEDDLLRYSEELETHRVAREGHMAAIRANSIFLMMPGGSLRAGQTTLDAASALGRILAP